MEKEIIKSEENQKNEKQEKEWYYADKLWNLGADIMFAYGQRGDGKTTDGLRKGLQLFFKYGYKMIYLRRQERDLLVKNGIDMLWNYLVESGELEKISGGLFNNIRYYNSGFYLGNTDNDGNGEWSKTPFCKCLAINMSHHYRGNPWTGFHYILFDEFIPETDEGYLVNEFTKFINLVHTVKREKEYFKILAVGNTINKYNIYFNNFGLTDAKKQKQGTIQVYTNKETYAKIAIEYCAHMEDTENTKFFSVFNSEALDMILHGGWQAPYAPPKPIDFEEDDIEFIYFIKFDNEYLQCEIIEKDDLTFTFVHRKTSDIYDENEDLVFTQDYDVRDNWRRNIMKPFDNIGRIICSYFEKDKVFYQDNEVGQMMKNYIKWCTNN